MHSVEAHGGSLADLQQVAAAELQWK